MGGLSAEVTSLTLHQLRPETSYEFAVLARNRLGDGLYSEITTARTKGRSATRTPAAMAEWRDTPMTSADADASEQLLTAL